MRFPSCQIWTIACLLGCVQALYSAKVFSEQGAGGSVIVREDDIKILQPGPHSGGGVTTAFPFFLDAADLDTVFKKRILHKGSAIGYHLQEKDEIYYVLSGIGDYTLNGQVFRVGAGMGLLTRAGDSHGLRTAGDADLEIIIIYRLGED